MEYRNLGRTGVQVSALCLGCMNFGGRASETASIQIIDLALAAGINFLDTANVYGHNPAKFAEGRGRSEEIIGKALQQTGKRHQIVLATKLHYPMSDDLNEQGNSRRHIIEQCEASLKRLQTDYIDLYQLHAASALVPIDESLRALSDLIQRGLVRYIGVSGFPAWRLLESLWVAKEYGLDRFVCEQPPYNLLDRRIERELLPMAHSYGLGVIVWAPTAGGFLSGKYRQSAKIPRNSRFETFWKGFAPEHFTEFAYAVLREVEALSAKKGCTSAQLALAWVMRQPNITSAITGPRTPEQLEENLGALEIEFTPDDLARLDNVAPPGKERVSYYGDGWDGWRANQFRW